MLQREADREEGRKSTCFVLASLEVTQCSLD
jgi:hypothetical protein